MHMQHACAVHSNPFLICVIVCDTRAVGGSLAQASLSRSVKEAKVSDFIASRTKSGQDVLDPTGRAFAVQPSQVTTIKDHSFGLGKAPSDLLEKVISPLAIDWARV